jgi:hypothetical protein
VCVVIIFTYTGNARDYYQENNFWCSEEILDSYYTRRDALQARLVKKSSKNDIPCVLFKGFSSVAEQEGAEPLGGIFGAISKNICSASKRKRIKLKHHINMLRAQIRECEDFLDAQYYEPGLDTYE